MKKSIILLAILFSLVIPGAGNADTFTYTGPAALNTMYDSTVYTWGFSGELAGQEITEVVLQINGVTDSEPGSSHWLFIHALDTTALQVGVLAAPDSDAYRGAVITDYFQPNGVHVNGTPGWEKGDGSWVGPQAFIDAWHDFNTPAQLDNLVYTFSTMGLLDTFKTFAADGNFGFGFDGDCYYTNQGITLTITTATKLPESGGILLQLCTAFVGVGLCRTRRATA